MFLELLPPSRVQARLMTTQAIQLTIRDGHSFMDYTPASLMPCSSSTASLPTHVPALQPLPAHNQAFHAGFLVFVERAFCYGAMSQLEHLNYFLN